jgi:hypothetical protein
LTINAIVLKTWPSFPLYGKRRHPSRAQQDNSGIIVYIFNHRSINPSALQIRIEYQTCTLVYAIGISCFVVPNETPLTSRRTAGSDQTNAGQQSIHLLRGDGQAGPEILLTHRRESKSGGSSARTGLSYIDDRSVPVTDKILGLPVAGGRVATHTPSNRVRTCVFPARS